MRIFVTGSEGFIGKHVVAAFRGAGHEVTGFDKKRGWNLVTQSLESLKEPDLIIHLASSVSTPGSIERPVETFLDTVTTTVNVLEYARSEKVPVLITSSVKARDGKTPYGAAKVMVETWAREYHTAYGVPIIINRPGTVYGPGQEGSTESGWIAWFLRARGEGRKVMINGSGNQRRDLLHVHDYAALLQQQVDDYVLGKVGWCAQIEDVGGGVKNSVSVLEMVHYLGLDHEFGPVRYGDAQVYVGVNRYPGWHPVINWKESDVFAGLHGPDK